MQLSERGTNFIHQFEGLRLFLYNDPANHATIGWGHLVHRGPIDGRASEAPFSNGITRAEADRLFTNDAARFEDAINRLITVPLQQHQFDALVSWAFNVGVGNNSSGVTGSALRQRLNNGEYEAVPEELARWNRGGGKVIAGLTNRRHKEALLFAYGDYGDARMTIELSWPTDFDKITQMFGARPEVYRKFNLPGHEGLDIRAPTGTNVYACAPGIVKAVYAALDQPYGLNVRISHPGGWETIYAHLKSSLVKVGQQVGRRQHIAIANNSGTNTSAPHLHLTLKKAGATARNETIYPNDIVDPMPYLLKLGQNVPVFSPRVLPNHPLRGLHGDQAIEWMVEQQVRGWAVEAVYAGAELAPRRFDDSGPAASGIRVIRRLNYSFAAGDGGLGTLPRKERYDDFAAWCNDVIANSKGVWGWIIGNEPNRAAERPIPDVAITPDEVTYVYNQVWHNAPKEARISPPALDPTNVESGDPREYFRRMLANLEGAEFFALHAYGYGIDQPINSSERFRDHPMTWQFHSFRMWEPFADVLYSFSRDNRFPYRTLPIVITEANHLTLRDGQANGWEADAGAWARSAMNYVREWNSGVGEQFVHGVCLYRYEGDAWALRDKPQVLQALRESGQAALV